MDLEKFIFCKNIDEASEKIAKELLFIAQETIVQKNFFRIVLAGGNSFIKVYEILSNSNSKWDKWHLYIGDERCLPVNSKYRNDRLIRDTWLVNGNIPEENINFISAEINQKLAAEKYSETLKLVPDFDVVLLGMGEDGHTASLFPNQQNDESNFQDVLIVKNAPKYPKKRISLSYQRLNRTQNIFKLVCGESKLNALKLWIKGKDLPINKIVGEFERVFVCEEIFDQSYIQN